MITKIKAILIYILLSKEQRSALYAAIHSAKEYQLDTYCNGLGESYTDFTESLNNLLTLFRSKPKNRIGNNSNNKKGGVSL